MSKPLLVEPCAVDPDEKCADCPRTRKTHGRVRNHDFNPSRSYTCRGCGDDVAYDSDSRDSHPDYDHDFQSEAILWAN